MTVYPDAMTLGEARTRFFARWSLGPDGGYGDRWVRVETKPIPVYFPNTRCRVEAARLHDLHHVATGYEADWAGEAQIAAWEIAGGCGRHGWAWMLNLGAFTVGMALCPRRLFRAFVRGSRAYNLYHARFGDDQLATVTVGELRRRIGIVGADPAPTASDRLRFAAWCAAALAWHLGSALGGAGAVYLAARAAGLLRAGCGEARRSPRLKGCRWIRRSLALSGGCASGESGAGCRVCPRWRTVDSSALRPVARASDRRVVGPQNDNPIRRT